MDSSLATVAMSTPSIVLSYAAAFFFVVVAVAAAYALVKAGKALERVDKVLADVDQEGVRDRVPGVLEQDVDHLLGVMAGGPGVPESERRQPVGVHVLGGAFQLGKRCDGPTCSHGVGVVDLEEECLVALNDQGSVSHGVRQRYPERECSLALTVLSVSIRSRRVSWTFRRQRRARWLRR